MDGHVTSPHFSPHLVPLQVVLSSTLIANYLSISNETHQNRFESTVQQSRPGAMQYLQSRDTLSVDSPSTGCDSKPAEAPCSSVLLPRSYMQLPTNYSGHAAPDPRHKLYSMENPMP